MAETETAGEHSDNTDNPSDEFTGADLLVVLLGVVVIGNWVLSTNTLRTVIQGLQTVAPLLTGLGGLGTLILAYLYLQQRDLLEEQVETQTQQATIMGRQEELMEVDRQPVLDIADREMETDTAHIWISNVGAGAATDLTLVTEVDFPATEAIAPGRHTTRLMRGEEKPLDDDRPADPAQSRTRLERSIRPHQEKVHFQAQPGLSIVEQASDQLHPYGFIDGTRRLIQEDVERFKFQLYVRYSTQLGDQEEISVFGFPRTIDLSDDDKELSFYAAYERGAIISEDELNSTREASSADN